MEIIDTVIPLETAIIGGADSATNIILVSQMHPYITMIFVGVIILLVGFIGYSVYKDKKKIK